MAKIHDINIPIARNQNMIMKMLMSHRKDVIDIAYITENDDPAVLKKCHELLESTDVSQSLIFSSHIESYSALFQPKDKNLRKYHLRLVALVSACAEV